MIYKNLYSALLVATVLICSSFTTRYNLPNYTDVEADDELIIGTWKIDSVLLYYNGAEIMLRPEDNHDMDYSFVGSIEDPRFRQFTRFNDFLTYHKSTELSDRLVSKYLILRNFVVFDQIEDEPFKILELTSSKLVLQIEMQAKPHFVQVNYHSKVSNP